MTMSFAKGKKSETSIHHNNRSIEKNFDYEKKGHRHIDPNLTYMNRVLIHDNIRDVYQHEFGNSVAEYNTNQKRKDRKIKDYYEKIKNSNSMRTQYEFIVQVGNKSIWQQYDRHGDLWKIGRIMLTKYYETFQKRNPNLRVYNAAIHMDEQGSPHLHLNVVPIAHGYKQGVRVRPSFDRALKEQGIQSDPRDSRSLFRNFQEQEQSALAQIASKYYVERVSGITNKLRDVHEYKQVQRMIEHEKEYKLQAVKQQVTEHQVELNLVKQSVAKEKLKQEKLQEQNKYLKQQQEIEKEQLRKQQELRQAVLAKQDQEIKAKKKLLEELKARISATRDRATEIVNHVATSVRELSENASQAFMRKFGELEMNSKIKQGYHRYDVELPEFEKAKLSDKQIEDFANGVELANDKHDKALAKQHEEVTNPTNEIDEAKKREQYKQYLAQRGYDR